MWHPHPLACRIVFQQRRSDRADGASSGGAPFSSTVDSPPSIRLPRRYQVLSCRASGLHVSDVPGDSRNLTWQETTGALLTLGALKIVLIPFQHTRYAPVAVSNVNKDDVYRIQQGEGI